jgi:hypothetical protein
MLRSAVPGRSFHRQNQDQNQISCCINWLTGIALPITGANIQKLFKN